MKILIDNGHGAETRGKRSPDGRLLEYRENRIIARGIVDALTARGLDASLLVPEETDISLPERCRRVNEWCRQLGRRNVILISIHCPRLVRLHHSRYHRCRCPRHLPLQRRPDPPPRPAPSHRLHRRRPRSRERLLSPTPYQLPRRPHRKPLHGQSRRL